MTRKQLKKVKIGDKLIVGKDLIVEVESIFPLENPDRITYIDKEGYCHEVNCEYLSKVESLKNNATVETEKHSRMYNTDASVLQQKIIDLIIEHLNNGKITDVSRIDFIIDSLEDSIQVKAWHPSSDSCIQYFDKNDNLIGESI